MEKTKITEYIRNKTVKSDNRKSFDELLVISVGAEFNKPYYPTAVDEFGNKLKDENGNLVKSDIKHYIHAFSELGTSKMVKLVTSDVIDIKMFKVYRITGRGYDINSANMLFIDLGGKINDVE